MNQTSIDAIPSESTTRWHGKPASERKSSPTEGIGTVLAKMGLPVPNTPEAEAWVAAGKEREPEKVCRECDGRGMGWVSVERDGVLRFKLDACGCAAGDRYRAMEPKTRSRRFAAINHCDLLFDQLPWNGRGIYEAMLADFPAQRQVIELAIEENRGVYVWGPPGRGKTHMAAAILKAAGYGGRIVDGFTLARWFTELRGAIDAHKKDESAPSVEQLVSRASDADVLVIDDIGAEKLTDWNGERLYELIDERWLNSRGCMTIVTSNYSLTAVENRLAIGIGEVQAARLVSRIGGMCPVDINLTGEDRRLGQ